MKIYKLKVWDWEDHFATKELVATALGYTAAQIDAAVAANIAAGLPGYPVSATIPVGFTGRLAGLRIQGVSVQCILTEIDVVTG